MTFHEQLTVDLWILDALLTEGDPRSGKGDPDKLIEDELGYIEGGQEYYLSDGGYSRVCLGSQSRRLFLTSNSTDNVRERWDLPAVQAVRERIESRIGAEYARLLAE